MSPDAPLGTPEKRVATVPEVPPLLPSWPEALGTESSAWEGGRKARRGPAPPRQSGIAFLGNEMSSPRVRAGASRQPNRPQCADCPPCEVAGG